MNCPQCRTNVADGTSICPRCDYILDASFLSDEPAAPRRPTTASRPARPVAGAKDVATVIKSVEQIEAQRPRPATPARPAPKPRPEPEPRVYAEEVAGEGSRPGSSYVTAEAALEDVKTFVRELRLADKLAFLGAAATVLMCFLPWKETAEEGEVLGLMSLGAVVFALSIVAMTSVYVRLENTMPQLQPFVPWLVQLGALAFGLLWSVVYIKLSSDHRMRPGLFGDEVALSSPSLGVFIAIVTQIIALAGTVMGLRERPA